MSMYILLHASLVYTVHNNYMAKDSSAETMGGFVIEVIKMFFLALVIIVPIRVFLFQPFIVRGASMEPNFHEKQYLIINEFGYKNVELFGGKFTVEPRKKLNRGESIVFRAPHQFKDFYIKRVVGIPGESVQVKDGIVTIFSQQRPDGYVLDESAYLPVGRRTTGDVKHTLGADEYFVLGDNRNASSDSRVFGPIKSTDVIGRVLLRAFPFTELKVY